MKLSKWILVVIGVVVLACLASYLLKRRPSQESPTATSGSETQESPGPAAATPAQANPDEAAPEQAAASPSALVEIRGDEVVATVNGVPVKGKDMMLIGKDFADKPQPLAADAYDFLLKQAVGRELVRQAAIAEGITLTEGQRGELGNVKGSVLARRADPASGSLRDSGTVEERTEFEQTAAENDMLLTNLMEKRGVPRPDASATDDQVQAFYKEHEQDFGALPKDAAARAEAWKAVEFRIRQQIAYAIFSKYNAERRKVIDELKTNATISVLGAK